MEQKKDKGKEMSYLYTVYFGLLLTLKRYVQNMSILMYLRKLKSTELYRHPSNFKYDTHIPLLIINSLLIYIVYNYVLNREPMVFYNVS